MLKQVGIGEKERLLRERITLGTTSGPKGAFSFVICLISASLPAHNQPTHLLSNQYVLYIGLLEQETNM
jgi:hypothetical protein